MRGQLFQEVMAVPVYSHSRLSVYETCPRQYKALSRGPDRDES